MDSRRGTSSHNNVIDIDILVGACCEIRDCDGCAASLIFREIEEDLVPLGIVGELDSVDRDE